MFTLVWMNNRIYKFNAMTGETWCMVYGKWEVVETATTEVK
jgi:hypothetical protein